MANEAWVVYALGANYEHTCLQFTGYSTDSFDMTVCINEGCPQEKCTAGDETVVSFGTPGQPVINGTTPVHSYVGKGNAFVGFYFLYGAPVEPTLVLQMTQYNCSAENLPSPVPSPSPPAVSPTHIPHPNGTSPSPHPPHISPNGSPHVSPGPITKPKKGGLKKGEIVIITFVIAFVLIAGIGLVRFQWKRNRDRELQPLLINAGPREPARSGAVLF
eukprot:TRINITY_DN2814_c0_g2_i3.p1 TRINITY_DN2814_c0_g2~~TRINITY_DN2814_c0_g2_i3.p1  ORF type:complete len:217 (-),score=31.29 TRINITY_DN2814_c0_g2_i3:260-910(-)